MSNRSPSDLAQLDVYRGPLKLKLVPQVDVGSCPLEIHGAPTLTPADASTDASTHSLLSRLRGTDRDRTQDPGSIPGPYISILGYIFTQLGAE